MRNLEDFAQLSTTLATLMAENLRHVEEAQRRRDELLQQLLQAVAVMQADIIRIDETHS